MSHTLVALLDVIMLAIIFAVDHDHRCHNLRGLSIKARGTNLCANIPLTSDLYPSSDPNVQIP